MNYPEPLPNILREVFNDLTATVQIIEVSTAGNIHTVEVCDPYYMEVGRTVIIGGNNYVVKTINYLTNTITVEGTASINVDSFTLYAAFFFHGTPRAVNSELHDQPNASDKTPMGWLLETYEEAFPGEVDTVLDRESDIRLFFLTQANFNEWLTQDFYNNAIEPMRRLMYLFINTISNNPLFDMIDVGYEVTNHAKFGVYITNQGVENGMFVDNLSGCELRIRLKIFKRDICPTCP